MALEKLTIKRIKKKKTETYIHYKILLKINNLQE